MQLAKFILYQARTREDDPAVALVSGVATYGMLARAVESAVARIAALELRHGAIVVVEVRNPFHHIALLIALFLSGLASASIQSRHHLTLTGVVPDAVLTDAPDFTAEGSKVAIVGEDWFLIDPARPVDYARLIAMPGFENPADVIRVMFSSGTTGFPKAIAMNLRSFDHRFQHGNSLGAGPQARETRILTLLGMSTLMGFSTPLIALSTGGVVAFAADIPNAVNLIRMFRIEVLQAAVFQLNALLKHLEGKPPLASIRTVGTGGSKLPARLLMAARQKLGTDVLFTYASTEAGMLSTAKAQTLELYPDSAGYLLPWVEMEAVTAAGAPVPDGQDGILRVRTNEIAHYLSETPDPTERFGAAWFYPGDVGRVTPEGIVYVTGRTSEIINRGGVIVAPDMIEEVLLLVPGVKDAAVFGVTNADGIEEIWAALAGPGFIDTNAARAVVGARMSDRVPDRIVQVETIPRNEMGKIRRKELKDSVVSKPA